jgi:hypothetical protein
LGWVEYIKKGVVCQVRWTTYSSTIFIPLSLNPAVRKSEKQVELKTNSHELIRTRFGVS